MANEPIVRIFVQRFRSDKQKELLAMLKDKQINKQANEYVLNAINSFVPMLTGALRRSGEATPESISWGKGLEYARYQFGGKVYGPNHPVVRGGRIVGWYSTPGMKKYPTGRELGVPGYWMGWRFGYTTRGTHHHWDRYFKYYPKLKANLEVTRMLKRECKKRGLKA